MTQRKRRYRRRTGGRNLHYGGFSETPTFGQFFLYSLAFFGICGTVVYVMFATGSR